MKKILFYSFLLALIWSCSEDSNFVFDNVDDTALELRGSDKDTTCYRTPPPLKITVPNGATPAQVKKAVHDALDAAIKGEKDPAVKNTLKEAKTAFNDAAAAGVSGALEDLDGLTFPYFKVKTVGGRLVIIAISIQVLNPPKPPPAGDIVAAHEDGHSLITSEVSKRVIKKATEDAKKAGKKGKALKDAVRNKVIELDTIAQKAFDKRTNSGQIGTAAQQTAWAQEEANKVIDAYLASEGVRKEDDYVTK